MENQHFKKSLFGGFNREEVLAYFDSMCTEYQGEIEDFKVESRRHAAEKAQLEADLDDLKNQLRKQHEQIEKLEQILCKQQVDNERLRQLNIAVDKSAKETQANNAELVNQLNVVTEELQIKTARLKQFEEVGFNAEKVITEAYNRAASVLADANNRAAAILTSAGKKSRDIEEKTKEEALCLEKHSAATQHIEKVQKPPESKNLEAAQIAEQMNKRVEQTIQQANEEAKRITEQSNERAEQTIRQANEEANKIIQDAHGYAKNVNSRCEQLNREVTDSKATVLRLLQEVQIKIGLMDEHLPVFMPEINPEVPEETKEAQGIVSDTSVPQVQFFR